MEPSNGQSFMTPYKEEMARNDKQVEADVSKKQNSMVIKGHSFFSPTVLMSSNKSTSVGSTSSVLPFSSQFDCDQSKHGKEFLRKLLELTQKVKQQRSKQSEDASESSN